MHIFILEFSVFILLFCSLSVFLSNVPQKFLIHRILARKKLIQLNLRNQTERNSQLFLCLSHTHFDNKMKNRTHVFETNTI